MRISVTERQTFKRCRRKWNYTSSNRQSLSPVVNAPALDLGTLIHQTLAAWTQAVGADPILPNSGYDPSFDPIQYYRDASAQYFSALVALYTERVGCAPSAAELGPTMEAIGLGLSMIENYQKKWRTPIPAGFTLVANEQAIVQPIPGTEMVVCEDVLDGHCDCPGDCCSFEWPSCDSRYPNHIGSQFCPDCSKHSAQHELECTFDGLMADANGDLYIIERKTFSRTPSLDELNNNDQFLAYQWAASQAFGTQRIVGMAYDGLLKKPKPSGVHKTIDDLFLRRILLRPQAELIEFETMLAAEAKEMAAIPNTSSSPLLYKTVPPVMGCQRWECSFLDVCHATSKGEPTEHLLKMFTRTDRKSHLGVATEVEP